MIPWRHALKKITQTGLFIEFSSQFLAFAAVFAAVAVIFSSPSLKMTKEETARIADSEAVSGKKYPVIVIDAGHGGADGGAVAPDGTCEKDINLNIAKNVDALLTSLGFECVMTREDDVMLSDGSGASAKMSDLKQRVAETDGKDCIFVSIHQNKFPQDKCSGTQVYYSKNDPESAKLADTVQECVRKYIQQHNTRQIKPAGSEIFVLDRCRVPAVLIECGFLSNPAELSKLKDTEYQKELSCAVAAAVSSYITSR